MKIGTCIEGYGDVADFESLIRQIVRAEADGFESIWFGAAKEPLITCAVAGRETSTIEMMSAIVVSFVRHPVALAQQALTTNAATNGRFVLGIGPASRPQAERLGFDYDRSAAQMREYVTVVKALVDEGKVAFEGEFYKADTAITYPWARPMPVLMSALGSEMLRNAGEVADGTVTWMAGVETVEKFVAPRITRAAEAAGRPAPRIAVGLPIAVHDNAAAAREQAGKQFANYANSPHYRKLILRQGEGIEDVVICGTEREVEQQLRDLAAAGATEFYAYPFAVGDNTEKSLSRTREFVASLVGHI